jgi:transcriptional regulator with XRE-family HTH domain
MASENPLGDFLRARRELVRPEEVGLPTSSRRRVPGLRREEVAMLAGISAEYYLRLERGRDRSPSIQVVESLASVLQLDAESTAYLLELARPRQRAKDLGQERVPSGILMLLDTLQLPAFVVNRYRDVLAANVLAQTLSPLSKPGVNRLIALFTDPTAQAFHPDWEQGAIGVVAQLRAEAGADVDDPRLQALVGELSVKSERFRQLWARHDVRRGGSATGVIRHPAIGDLRLYREKLAIGGADGLILVIYHPEPGSAEVDALRLLGSLAHTSDQPSTASHHAIVDPSDEPS